jgi:hypothetical protein
MLSFSGTAITPATAHHAGFIGFDPNEEVTLMGTIREFDYINPHAWIVMDVTKEDGSIARWNIESVSPIVLSRAGIDSSSLTPGEMVTVRAHPSDDEDEGFAWLIDVTKTDGTVLSVRGMNSMDAS